VERLLREEGVSADVKNVDGMSPLHLAVYHYHAVVVRALNRRRDERPGVVNCTTFASTLPYVALSLPRCGVPRKMRPSVASLIDWYRGSNRAWRRAWKNDQPSISSTDHLAPSYLLHHNSSEIVCDEDQRTLNLLSQCQYLIHTPVCQTGYLRLFS
jgi:hypothetical protein